MIDSIYLGREFVGALHSKNLYIFECLENELSLVKIIRDQYDVNWFHIIDSNNMIVCEQLKEETLIQLYDFNYMKLLHQIKLPINLKVEKVGSSNGIEICCTFSILDVDYVAIIDFFSENILSLVEKNSPTGDNFSTFSL